MTDEQYAMQLQAQEMGHSEIPMAGPLNLTPMEAQAVAMEVSQQVTMDVTVPEGLAEGDDIEVQAPAPDGRRFKTKVPANCTVGSVFQVPVPPTPAAATPTAAAVATPAARGMTPVTAVPMTQGPISVGSVGTVGALGLRQPSLAQEITIGNHPHNLSDIEVVAMNYRYSVRCFAFIDLFFTVLNMFSRKKLVVYASLILVIGPICGYTGAKRLNKNLILVYLVFSLIKCVYEVVLAFVLPSLWMLLLGLVEIWIAKIIYMLWKAVSMIPAERIEDLLNPAFEQEAHAHIVYW
eukprot:CAMPEP_0182573598 /NCGR_PEP_ID=MMETSP1324-20130603/20312_1 /TAXON_ID=236786 /ORGANISM="Florenciella sp., Strain RCC1587" /LENGTH=292 /DNA_ID=CAMNT_0024788729 /DNA_START=137 /DNA_END=1012 /DNA_ORIENTATION=-